MTVETKTTIELSDVEAVEFECKNCHSVSKWPISIAKSPPLQCHCGSPSQWMTLGGDMHTNITHLIELMRQLGKAQNEPFAMRFTLKTSASVRVSDGKD